MLLIIEDLKQLDLDGIYRIYGAKPELYDYYLELFREKDAFCAVWFTDGSCRASLRIQRYEDGVLLSGLETAPDDRRKGYGYALVTAVLDRLKQRGVHRVYSHIDRRNLPSQRLHKKCGFYKLRDSARLLDDTVTTKMDTLCIDI